MPSPQERIAALEASFREDAEDDIMDNLTVMEVRDVRYLLRVAKAAVAVDGAMPVLLVNLRREVGKDGVAALHALRDAIEPAEQVRYIAKWNGVTWAVHDTAIDWNVSVHTSQDAAKKAARRMNRAAETDTHTKGGYDA